MSNKSIDLKYIINKDLLSWYQELSNTFYLIINEKGEIIFFSEDSLNYFSIKSIYELENSFIFNFIGNNNWNILEKQFNNLQDNLNFFDLPDLISNNYLSIKWKKFKDDNDSKYFLIFKIKQPDEQYVDYYKKALDIINIPVVIIRNNQFYYTNHEFEIFLKNNNIFDYTNLLNWLGITNNNLYEFKSDLNKNDQKYEIVINILNKNEDIYMISINKKVSEIILTEDKTNIENSEKIQIYNNIFLNIIDKLNQVKSEIEIFYKETQEKFASSSITVINNIKEQYNDYKDIINYTSENLVKMSENSNFIEELSIKIHIISINSAIESARLGEKGKSFSIISREIAKISEEMKSYVKLIENQIKNIREYNKKIYITETTSTTKTQVLEQTTDLQDKVKNIIDYFKNLIIDKINSLLKEIQN